MAVQKFPERKKARFINNVYIFFSKMWKAALFDWMISRWNRRLCLAGSIRTMQFKQIAVIKLTKTEICQCQRTETEATLLNCQWKHKLGNLFGEQLGKVK